MPLNERILSVDFVANWVLLPELFGPVHFQFKGCLVSFYYYRDL